MYNEITRNAFEGVPEKILAHESIQEAMRYVDGWVDEFESNWIDPHSDGYDHLVWESERSGAVAVVERYQDMLADALYRQEVLGIPFDLAGFIDRLSVTELDEVLADAR